MGRGGRVRPRRRVRRRSRDGAGGAGGPLRTAERRSARRHMRRGGLRAGTNDRRARRAVRPRHRRRRLRGDARARSSGRRGEERRLPSRRRATGWTRSRTAIADTLVCYLVLQHLPERQVVLRYLEEFGRVLTAGGSAFVQLPVLRDGLRPRAWRLVASRGRTGVERLPSWGDRQRRLSGHAAHGR